MTYERFWFEKLLDSTLGLPDQLFWRLMRVGQGKAKLFSQDGLLDESLIPLVGGFIDDDSRAVSPEEVNELLGKPFGDGWAGELATNILGAPTTFMSSGVTSAARAARKFGRARNALGGGPKHLQHMEFDNAIESLRADVMAGKLPKDSKLSESRVLALLDAAKKEGVGAGLSKLPVRVAHEKALDREMVLGLPFGIASSSLRIPIHSRHRGWVSLLSSPLSTPIARGVVGLADRNIPFLSTPAKEIYGLAAGWRSGDGAQRIVAANRALDTRTFHGKSFDEVSLERGGVSQAAARLRKHDTFRSRWAKRVKRTHADLTATTDLQWNHRVDLHLKKGTSAEDSYRILATSMGPGKTAAEKHAVRGKIRGIWKSMRQQLGLPEAELTHENIRKLMGEAASARDADKFLYESSTLSLRAASGFNQKAFDQAFNAFRAGRETRLMLRRMMFGVTGFTELDKVAKAKSRFQSASDESNEQAVRLLSKAIRSIAKEADMDSSLVMSNLSLRVQMLTQTDEWEVLSRAMNGIADPRQLLRMIERDLPNFIKRTADSARLLDDMAGGLAVGLRRGFTVDGVAGKVPKRGSNAAKIVELSQQLRRVAKNQRQAILEEGRISGDITEILPDLEEALMGFQEDVMRPFFDLAGDHGRRYLDALSSINTEKRRIGRMFGLLGESTPLAHQHRLATQAQAKAVRTLLGTLETSRPGLASRVRSVLPRELDSVTTETVDRMFDTIQKEALRHGDDELMETVEKVLKKDPEMSHKFSLQPHIAALADLGSKKKIEGIGAAFDGLMRVRDDFGQRLFEGGEVIAAGRGPIITEPAGGWRGSKSGEQFAVRAAERSMEMPDSWVLVRSEVDGKQHIIPLSTTEDPLGMAVQPLGEGASVGIAAGRSLGMSGELPPALGLHSTKDTLESLAGKRVLIGERSSMAAATRMFEDNHNALDAWLRTVYDPIHSMLKAAVTIVRPDFHLFNIASSFPMLHMQGLSYANGLGGMKDAIAMVTQKVEADSPLGRLATLENDGGGFLGLFRKAKLARVTAGEGGRRVQAKRTFMSGAGPVDLAELLSDIADEGGLNTLSRGGVGTGREPKAFARAKADRGSLGENIVGLLDSGKFYDSAGNISQKAADALSAIGESSEILARFAGIFGFMRQGYTARQATRATVRALIDYNDFTPFFKRGISRVFSFAKFPAKNLRNVAAFANTDLGVLTAQYRALYGLPDSEAEMGQLTVRGSFLDDRLEDYRVNVQRLLPQFDLMSSAAWIGDFFFDMNENSFDIEKVGEAPLRPAIPLTFLLPLGPGKKQASFANLLRESMRTSYLTRWAMQDPHNLYKPPETLLDKVLRHVAGVRKPGVALRHRWLRSQYAMVKRQIEQRLLEEEDQDERDWLVTELRRATSLLQRLTDTR